MTKALSNNSNADSLVQRITISSIGNIQGPLRTNVRIYLFLKWFDQRSQKLETDFPNWTRKFPSQWVHLYLNRHEKLFAQKSTKPLHNV